jgi:two-component system cell cycle response regulator DivK
MARPAVLLVDRDSDTRQIFRAMLEHHGYPVLDAADASAGLELFHTMRPDVVVSDYPIVLEDGSTLTSRLKSDPSTASSMLVTITSLSLPEVRQQALAEGCDGFYLKPISPSRMVEAIEQLVQAG